MTLRIRSIRVTITLWHTSLLAVTFVILAGTAYILVHYTLYREADSTLQGVAAALGERSKAEEGHHFPPDVNEIFRRFFGFFPTEPSPYFEWVDPHNNGRRDLSETNAPPFTDRARYNAMRGLATFETMSGAGSYPVRLLTWPVVESGVVIGVVRVGMSQRHLQTTMSRFLAIMAVLFPFALVLAAGGGWLFASRALRPVDRMTETARRIGAGQLNARLELTGANDELDRLAETLNGMLGRLEAAFVEMRQFTADASHELKTPLTILRGEIEVALRFPRGSEEYVEILKSALEEINRVSFLVEGLLLLARSDAGVLKMEHEPVALMQVVEDALDQATPLAQKASLAVILGNMDHLEVPGDFVHLRRAVFNLLDNAIKYTPAGGTVTISVEKSDSWAILSVKDTGIGIPHEEQRKVFLRFYRSAEARSGKQGGSGLGLSMVKSIVDAHGGKIEVESAPGEGSTFRICLPLS